jgi:LysR family transcriptional regulator, glycine cleavage system transcriptional activator
MSATFISATPDDWDWRKWAAFHELDWSAFHIANRFDTDDAAWGASAAGLGLTLASPRLIERELRSGILAVAGSRAGVHFGNYWMLPRPPVRRGAELFAAWLIAMSAEGNL